MRTEYILTAGVVAIVGVLLWNKDKITLMKGSPSISESNLSPRTPPQYPSPTEDAGQKGYSNPPVSQEPIPVDNTTPSACKVSTYMDWLNWLAMNPSMMSEGADDPDGWEEILTGIKTRQGCFGSEGGGSGGFAGALSDGQDNQYTPSAFVPSTM
jgi:hypothetical protein